MPKRAIIAALLCTTAAFAAQMPGTHRLDAAADPDTRLASNSVIDIVPQAESVWLGTGRGLSQLHLNLGQWALVNQESGIGRGGISALAVNDTIIWAATAYSVKTDYGWKPAGGGVGYSLNEGVDWLWMEQPRDSADVTDYSPTTTVIQNLTYDLALSSIAVWIGSFGGGLRKLTYENLADSVRVWQLVTPDGESFDPFLNYNHRVFSLIYARGSLWVGTAQGINRSPDEGVNWTNFESASGGLNTISGEFVTALAAQNLPTDTLIWAATWKAEAAWEYYGVSVTSDQGLNWRVALSDSSWSDDGGITWKMSPIRQPSPTGEYLIDEQQAPLRVHNFGFMGDTVLAAADDGLWLSADLGETWVNWTKDSPITDPDLGETLEDVNYYSAGGIGDTILVGTEEGFARGWFDTGLNRYRWKIHRAHRPAASAGEPVTYAYPNPFSPQRGHVTRLQVKVNAPTSASYAIYNFGMEKVVESAGTVLPGRGSGDMAGYGALKWDGRDGSGAIVANGVYFYKVEIGGESHWGKVMVLD